MRRCWPFTIRVFLASVFIVGLLVLIADAWMNPFAGAVGHLDSDFGALLNSLRDPAK